MSIQTIHRVCNVATPPPRPRSSSRRGTGCRLVSQSCAYGYGSRSRLRSTQDGYVLAPAVVAVRVSRGWWQTLLQPVTKCTGIARGSSGRLNSENHVHIRTDRDSGMVPLGGAKELGGSRLPDTRIDGILASVIGFARRKNAGERRVLWDSSIPIRAIRNSRPMYRLCLSSVPPESTNWSSVRLSDQSGAERAVWILLVRDLTTRTNSVIRGH